MKKNKILKPSRIKATQVSSHNHPKRKEQAKKCAIHPLQHLQQLIGNQTVHQFIQAKLKIGQPNDKYEQEADRVAEKVVNIPEPRVQRQPETEEENQIQTKPLADKITTLAQRQAIATEEEKEHLRTKCIVQPQPEEEKAEETIQPKTEEDNNEKEPLSVKSISNKLPSVSPNVQRSINTLRRGGQPLPQSVRNYFEPRFGADFSTVRIHNNVSAANTSKQLNARAFTFGGNIAFNDGLYQPDTESGKKLLAHELTHVVQQSSNRDLQKPAQLPSTLNQNNLTMLQRQVSKSKFKPITTPEAEKEYQDRVQQYKKQGKNEEKAAMHAMDDMFAERLKQTGGKRVAGSATFTNISQKTFLLVSKHMSIGGEIIKPGLYNAGIDSRSYNCHNYTFHNMKFSNDKKLKSLKKIIPKGAAKGKTYYDSIDLFKNGVHFDLKTSGIVIYPKWLIKLSEIKKRLSKFRPRKVGEKFSSNKGDIVMYSLGGDFPHSAKVTKVDRTGEPTRVKGKWGHFSLFEHDPATVPAHYGKHSYFRKK